MKTAQELRSGNVIMVGADPLVVQKAEYNKSGRNVGRGQDEAQEPAVGRRFRGRLQGRRQV